VRLNQAVVAAGLHAERVRYHDVAADPGAIAP
jgi:hypothetical protein